MDRLFDEAEKPIPTWTTSVVLPDTIPHQTNSFDCGVFVMALCRYIAFDLNFDFLQEHLPFIRRAIMYDIHIHNHMKPQGMSVQNFTTT